MVRPPGVSLVVSSATSIQDQTNEKCPFLSAATGELRKCVKSEAAKGVCTISCNSNGLRQDWLVCPYRALSAELVSSSVRRLFQVPNESNPFIAPAATLKREDVRDGVQKRLGIGQPVFVYFNTKMGGELSIPPTKNSPEFSFDVTVVELVMKDGKPHVGHFGILRFKRWTSTAPIVLQCATSEDSVCTPPTSLRCWRSIRTGCRKALKARTSPMSSSARSTR